MLWDYLYAREKMEIKMEDINNALLHIKAKHNGEIPYQYGSRECAKLMHSYAVEYHQAKLKLLGIADVVGQSEQLVCDVCGSNDVIEAPHMGKNCNRCHPL